MEEFFNEWPLGGMQMSGKGRLPKGAPRNVKDVYWRSQESDFDTMLNILLNILLRAEENIVDYIVL